MSSNEVQMPEADEACSFDRYAMVCLQSDAIAYADARCAALQDELEKRDRALRDVHWLMGEWEKTCEKAEVDLAALAAKVKDMEANDRRYRWLRDRATFENDCEFWLPSVIAIDYKPGAELNGMHETLDAAIDAAGEANDES